MLDPRSEMRPDGRLEIEIPNTYPPPCFIGLVKEGFPFLGKRKPSKGLSFQFDLYRGIRNVWLLEMLNRSELKKLEERA